jgi:hypothetical protein
VLVEGSARKGGGMLAGRSCTNRRVIFQEGPVPLGLDQLAQHAQHAQRSGLASGGGGDGGGLVGGGWRPALCGGPAGEPRPGDYVACVVREVVSGATLVAAPLARTTLAEFVRTFGATNPGRLAPGHAAAGWVAAAAGAAAWPPVQGSEDLNAAFAA